MRRPPLKFFAALSLMFCVATVVLWVRSQWFSGWASAQIGSTVYLVEPEPYAIYLEAGPDLVFLDSAFRIRGGWEGVVQYHDFVRHSLGFHWGMTVFSRRFIVVPYWFLVGAFTALPAAWLHRLGREQRKGLSRRYRVYRACAACSLVLCLAMTGLWMRSYWFEDEIRAFSAQWGAVAVYDEKGHLVAGYRTSTGGDRYDIQVEHVDLTRSGSVFGSTEGVSGEVYVKYWAGFDVDANSFLGFGCRREDEVIDSLFTPAEYGALTFTRYVLAIPIWFVVLATAIPTLILGTWLHRARRQHLRAQQGLCLNCGYDLRASSDRCPECGTIIVRTSAAIAARSAP